MNTQLNNALKKYTKEQLYCILFNVNTSYQMLKKERKAFTKDDFINCIISEVTKPTIDEEWFEGIINNEKWILEIQ